MGKGRKKAEMGGSGGGSYRDKHKGLVKIKGNGEGFYWAPSFSPPEVPSYSFPGLRLMEEVLKLAKGVTASYLAAELGISKWKVRSALAGLRAVGMVAPKREKGRILYKVLHPNGGSMARAYLDTYYMMLLPLTSGRTSKWVAKTFWPKDKERTAIKRATYLIRMGSELEFLNGPYLTEAGAREVIARAVEDIYFQETGGKTGKFVTLTKVLEALERWGADIEIVRASLLGALSMLDGNLSPAPNLSEKVKRDGIRGRRGYLYYLSLKGRRFSWTTRSTG